MKKKFLHLLVQFCFSKKNLAILSACLIQSVAIAQSNVTYGMEATTTSATNWINQGSSETITVVNNAAAARTGNSYLSFTTTSTSAGKYFYNNYVNVLPGVSNYFVYHIVWVKSSTTGLSADATMRYSSSAPPNTGSSGPTPSSYTAVNATDWTRVSYGPYNATNTTRYYFPAPRITGGGTGKFVYYDDGVIYFLTTNKPIDLVNPTAPTFGTSTTIELNWTNGSDGVGSEATGVQATLLLRTTNLTAENPVLNNQALYKVGQNPLGVTATAGDWEVVSDSIGAAINTYSINTPVPTKYAIVHRDLAFNYSTAGVTTVGAALPVSFGVINAVKNINGIKIDWSVVVESNMDKYFIEKSTDGRIFNEVGSVMAKNENNTTYTFLDVNPLAGTSFYRIKSVENEGSIKYSSVVRVSSSIKANGELNIFPNPIKGSVMNIQLSDIKQNRYALQVMNQQGQIVFFKNIQHIGGNAALNIQLPTSLTKGIYVVQFIGGATSLKKSVLIE
jgi:hypothetical protein